MPARRAFWPSGFENMRPATCQDQEVPIAVHIAVAGDDAYALPMAVTVRSAIESLGVNRSLTVHVLDCGLSEASGSRLRQSWRDPRVTVEWYRPNLAVLQELPTPERVGLGHVTVSTYARLLVESTVPADLDRVLFLDSDLLVLTDVGKLWEEDMGDSMAMGAPDVGAPWFDSEVVLRDRPQSRRRLVLARPIPDYADLGLAPALPYINAGLVLIDLSRWRTASVSERALRCLADARRQVVWSDQYALNVVLAGKWHVLHPAWNQGCHIHAYRRWEHSPFDREVFEEARDHPRVVHFTTGYKPWLPYYRGPYRRKWLDVVGRTAWAGWRPASPITRAAAIQAQRWKAISRTLSGAARQFFSRGGGPGRGSQPT